MRWISICKDDDIKSMGYYVDLGSTTLETEDCKNIGFSKNIKFAYIIALLNSIKYNGVKNSKKYISIN